VGVVVLNVGDRVGEIDGVAVGVRVILGALGLQLGAKVTIVGPAVGDADGALDLRAVGDILGADVGANVAATEGEIEGADVIGLDGATVTCATGEDVGALI